MRGGGLWGGPTRRSLRRAGVEGLCGDGRRRGLWWGDVCEGGLGAGWGPRVQKVRGKETENTTLMVNLEYEALSHLPVRYYGTFDGGPQPP